MTLESDVKLKKTESAFKTTDMWVSFFHVYSSFVEKPYHDLLRAEVKHGKRSFSNFHFGIPSKILQSWEKAAKRSQTATFHGLT